MKTPAFSSRCEHITQAEIRTMSIECEKVKGINLSQGVCDTPVPMAIQNAVALAMKRGINSYTRYDGLKDINSLLVVGGNAAYIMPHLQNWYGKVIDYTGWREFSGLHPADLNAAGGLRLALARLNAKK